MFLPRTSSNCQHSPSLPHVLGFATSEMKVTLPPRKQLTETAHNFCRLGRTIWVAKGRSSVRRNGCLCQICTKMQLGLAVSLHLLRFQLDRLNLGASPSTQRSEA